MYNHLLITYNNIYNLYKNDTYRVFNYCPLHNLQIVLYIILVKKKVISGGTLFNILTRFLMRLVYGVYQLQS